jgi:hypothetical protein
MEAKVNQEATLDTLYILVVNLRYPEGTPEGWKGR